MISILTNADRDTRFDAFDAMFRARAAVFHDRLGWAVTVKDGWETDRYDRHEDPVYVVTADAGHRLTGSLRVLPTTGETMLRNEFASFFDEPVDVESSTVWECTRFCVHPCTGPDARHGKRVSTELLIGLCRLCLSSGVEQVIGLYDQAMTRVYDRIGWSPVPLARSRPEIGKLVVGIWDVSAEALEVMARRVALYERNVDPGEVRASLPRVAAAGSAGERSGGPGFVTATGLQLESRERGANQR